MIKRRPNDREYSGSTHLRRIRHRTSWFISVIYHTLVLFKWYTRASEAHGRDIIFVVLFRIIMLIINLLLLCQNELTTSFKRACSGPENQLKYGTIMTVYHAIARLNVKFVPTRLGITSGLQLAAIVTF